MQRIKKLTLKPVISPITSQEKVTYSSSNKKIATVSSSGVITGKKKGTEKLSMIQFQKEQKK
ncbi:Ig-like domain-containing protein [Blautia wexlerae]|uniref:Ig-like domain-containing protein n=2 Tax=Blautia wexlerae TaxID=418240 RepID=UPI001FAC7A37|nr:Ig-like domain-containing protein [Blautia wexlerae]